MKRIFKTAIYLFPFGALTFISLMLISSCDYNNDDYKDHTPPDGMGSIVINNHTADDIAVFVDGIQMENTGDYSDKAYDLAPGKHRVVLDERGGDRNFRGDVDVLEGRLTIMDVTLDPNDFLSYDVAIFFD